MINFYENRWYLCLKKREEKVYDVSEMSQSRRNSELPLFSLRYGVITIRSSTGRVQKGVFITHAHFYWTISETN